MFYKRDKMKDRVMHERCLERSDLGRDHLQDDL